MTLTLNAGASYVNDFPVAIVLVLGVMLLGAAGVLLAPCAPVSTWSEPVRATVPNWLRSNVTFAAALPAFATYAHAHVSTRILRE